MGLQRVRHDLVTNTQTHNLKKKITQLENTDKALEEKLENKN